MLRVCGVWILGRFWASLHEHFYMEVSVLFDLQPHFSYTQTNHSYYISKFIIACKFSSIPTHIKYDGYKISSIVLLSTVIDSSYIYIYIYFFCNKKND